MLNYSLKTDEWVEESPEDVSIKGGLVHNPFPGLRPFTLEECHLFFGREGQVDEILVKLSQNHAITVMGYSGSGKSSLMHCGLVPVLYGGFMTDTSPYWQVISTRPGSSPIANLSEAITDHLVRHHQIEEKDRPIYRSIIGSVLRSGPDGLVEVSKFLQNKEGENIFFMIDQFEELFRHREPGNDDLANEATAYVNLILTATQQKNTPVYLAINMRSDFIGECSAFPGLTQMINSSNYLVPQMTREQKRMAIEGPVAVGGGKISQRLVKRLLTEVGDNQDQLPILQHALMRTWDYWVANRDPGEPMDIRHYNAIGKISQALSIHANEAFEELSSREKEIAQILFKNITEKSSENLGLRRACKIRLIAELADASESEVIKVVDQFRKPGRSFLMPGSQVVLDGSSVVELSHESMMRIWNRLSAWVDEEFESAQMYKRISEASAMYQIGKTGLWRPPDLQLALNWQKKQKPTRTWAQRYDIAFERAIVFLDTSRITYEAEIKNQEMLQRRRLRRARITSIVLGAAFIVAMLFLFYGVTQQLKAEKAAELANQETQKAILAKQEADRQRDIAEQQTRVANDRLRINNELIQKLNVALQEAQLAKLEAEKQFKEALAQKTIAEQQTIIAEKATEGFKSEFNRAEAALQRANRLLYLSVAQALEAKSVNLDDKDLAGLLAMQGYQFHTQYGGKPYDTYVFRGLYDALTKLSELKTNYNAVKVPGNLKNKMFALAVSQNTSTFYTSGDDGFIYQGDYAKQTARVVAGPNPFRNRVLALSRDEQYLVNGSDSSFIQVYRTGSWNDKPARVAGHKGFVNDIKFLPDDSGFISTGADKTLRFTNHRTGEMKLLVTLPVSLKSIDIKSDGKWLAGVAPTGELVLVDLTNNTFKVIMRESTRVLSVAFHPTRPIIAYGTEWLNEKGVPFKGTVKIYDMLFEKQVKELGGHKAGVADIEFSPNGKLLASAGLDKRLQMWVVDEEEDLPIQMDNNNEQVWDLGFAAGSDYLLTSCNKGEIRVWPTNPSMLAEQVCPKLSRNMTNEEWDIYVANGIPYENTCKSLLIKDL